MMVLPLKDRSLEFEGSFAPKEPSFFWRGVKIVVGLIKETPLSAIGFLILGIVLRILVPPLAGCCFALFIGTLTSKFTLKVLTHFRFEALDTLERKALQFQKDHPYLQAISLAATFGLAILSIPVSIVAGSALGIFNGIVSEANHRSIVIEKKRAEEKEGDLLQLNVILTC